jgi:hypothetical protein
LNFTIFGGVLIRNLKVYFKERYKKQRQSIVKALLLLSLALSTLLARYSFQFLTLGRISASESVSLWRVLSICLISDFVPLIALLLCMKEVEKGEWDYLLASQLQEEDELSSAAGSHMLSTLRE